MDKSLKRKKIIAKIAIITGMILVLGSSGAYENGDYTLWQFLAGGGAGIVLVCTGIETWKEV